MSRWSIHQRPKILVTHGKDGQVKSASFAGMAVVASAALVSKDQVRSVVGRKSGDWQKDIWDLYDDVPELRFGVSWTANACSRARLYVGEIDPDGSAAPVPLNIATGSRDGAHGTADSAGREQQPAEPEEQDRLSTLLRPLNELAGGYTGQGEMLKRLAIHLNVPGESYLIGFDDPDTGERRWLVCSADEVQAFGDNIKIISPDYPGRHIVVEIAGSTIMRIWRPHPRMAQEADSPVRALRGPLRELLDLSAHVNATAESRLAGAGVLFVPDELGIPRPQQSEDGPNPLHSDPFIASLIEAMAAPLKNRDSASAVVPLVVRGPATAGKEMKHISFATDFDARVQEMREQAIRRIATGLDLPAEILTGLGETNHWTSWSLEEGAIKLHVEPLLGLICDALTTQFYQPALRALGVEDWARYALWFETSDLALRPNRSPEASEAYSKGIISEATYRREIGFSDEDAPSDAERAYGIARQVALTNANLAPILLPRLGIPLTPEEREKADPQGTPAPAGAVKNTTTKAPPVAGATPGGRNAIPAQRTAAAIEADPADAWMISCLDMAVRRALTRAGQHLIRSTPRSQRVELQKLPRDSVHTHLAAEPEQLDSLLHGAYDDFVEAVPNQPCLHQAVDYYVRALITAREEHHVGYLQRAITQFGCA